MANAAQEAERRFRHKCQIIFVIKPDKTSISYRDIKRISDSVLGIPSQCVVGSNLGFNELPGKQDGRRGGVSPQYTANVSLKVRPPP